MKLVQNWNVVGITDLVRDPDRAVAVVVVERGAGGGTDWKQVDHVLMTSDLVVLISPASCAFRSFIILPW